MACSWVERVDLLPHMIPNLVPFACQATRENSLPNLPGLPDGIASHSTDKRRDEAPLSIPTRTIWICERSIHARQPSDHPWSVQTRKMSAATSHLAVG
jgi:hypothetical protein